MLLTEGLFHDPTLPVAQPAVFGLRCHRCRARLPRGSDGPVTVEQTMRVEALSFQLVLEAPGVTCADCGARQVLADRETANDIADAMAQAFRGARFD